MNKENVRAFLEYRYKPLSDKQVANMIFLICAFGAMSAYGAYSLNQLHIMRALLFMVIGFAIFSVISLYKKGGNMVKAFMYGGAGFSCLCIIFLTLGYLICLGYDEIHPFFITFIVVPASLIGIPLSLMTTKKRIERGRCERPFQETFLEVSGPFIGAFAGWFFARFVFPNFSPQANFLIMVVTFVFLPVMFSIISITQFYKYYLAKKYEIE